MTPQTPWWQRAAQAGATGMQGTQAGQKPNPWAQLGTSAGAFGHGIQDKIKQRRAQEADPATAMTDPQVSNPGNYGPANPADSGMMGPPEDPNAMDPMASMDDVNNLGEPMADGKIVTKPTLALMGERGPEMAVPLGFRAHAKARPSMAMRSPGRHYYGG